MKHHADTPAAPALNTRSLRYLHEVQLHGGVRAAADVLGLDPSAISRQVGRLEHEQGVTLLERHGRGVRLTEVGLQLVEHYRDGKRRDADMLSRIVDYRDLRRGQLKVGIGEGRLEALVASALKPFSLRFPDILIELRGGTTAEIVSIVREGAADLAVCTVAGRDPAIRARVFPSAPLCALVEPRHPLARDGSVRLDRLAGERMIFLPPHFQVQRHIDAIIQAEAVDLRVAYRCDGFSAAQALAAAGLGVALMSSDAGRLAIESGRLAAVRIDHPIARTFQTQLIRRVGGTLSPAAEVLWRHLALALRDRAAS